MSACEQSAVTVTITSDVCSSLTTTSTYSSRMVEPSEQIAGKGVSDDFFGDQTRPEPGFDNINVVIRLSLWLALQLLMDSLVVGFDLCLRSEAQTATQEISRHSTSQMPDKYKYWLSSTHWALSWPQYWRIADHPCPSPPPLPVNWLPMFRKFNFNLRTDFKPEADWKDICS